MNDIRKFDESIEEESCIPPPPPVINFPKATNEGIIRHDIQKISGCEQCDERRERRGCAYIAATGIVAVRSPTSVVSYTRKHL